MSDRDRVYVLAVQLEPSPLREAILLTCVQAEQRCQLRARETVEYLSGDAIAPRSLTVIAMLEEIERLRQEGQPL